MSVSPLLQALYEGRSEAVEQLRRPDLDVFEAAALGDVSRLRELLDGGADPNEFAPTVTRRSSWLHSSVTGRPPSS